MVSEMCEYNVKAKTIKVEHNHPMGNQLEPCKRNVKRNQFRRNGPKSLAQRNHAGVYMAICTI